MILIIIIVLLMMMGGGIGAIFKSKSLRTFVLWLIVTSALCVLTGGIGLILSVVWAIWLMRKHKKATDN